MNPYTPSSQCIIYCRTNIWSQIVFWLILFCTFNIIRFLLNYKYKMGEKTFVDDIVKHSVSEQENIPWYTNSRALTPKLLGCIAMTSGMMEQLSVILLDRERTGD